MIMGFGDGHTSVCPRDVKTIASRETTVGFLQGGGTAPRVSSRHPSCLKGGAVMLSQCKSPCAVRHSLAKRGACVPKRFKIA